MEALQAKRVQDPNYKPPTKPLENLNEFTTPLVKEVHELTTPTVKEVTE